MVISTSHSKLGGNYHAALGATLVTLSRSVGNARINNVADFQITQRTPQPKMSSNRRNLASIKKFGSLNRTATSDV